jgi:malate/lactate dehydrogenase
VNPDDPPERQEVQKKQSVSGGKCLDIFEGLPTIGKDVRCVGSKDYSAIDGAELIINTAGVPRKARPDGTFPSREELLTINLKVTNEVAAGITKYCPDATNTMVPVRSSCLIAGIPVTKFLDDKTLEAIETRTRKAGGEVVGLLGFGSASFPFHPSAGK